MEEFIKEKTKMLDDKYCNLFTTYKGLKQDIIQLIKDSNQVEPLVMQKIADTVKDIMQEGFEIAMGGNIDLSEEANRREQTARYDRAVKNYTEIIARNFSA